MKHKDPVRAELQWRERMTSELYRMQWEKNPGDVFVLHDGPPYANGDLHMGEMSCIRRFLCTLSDEYASCPRPCVEQVA
jgi:hypothetical protein